MKNYITLLFAFATLLMNAQDPQIAWQKTIGGDSSDQSRLIAPSSDGGFLMAIQSLSGISGNRTVPLVGFVDVWLVKLDASGNIQWQKAIGGDGSEAVSSLEPTSDGGYILGVQSDSNASADKSENSKGGRDFWIVKLNADGTIAWENTIGGSEDESLPKVLQTLDGGYFVGGSSPSNISGDKTENSVGNRDYWVLKLDASGTIVWQNTIGGDNLDSLNDILLLDDGGYILGGTSDSNASGDKTENNNGSSDYWIVKLDADGNLLWENTIGGSEIDTCAILLQKDSDTIVVGGFSNSGISGDKTEASKGELDLWVLTLDSNSGEIQSQKTLGGDLNELGGNAIISRNDNYIFAISSMSSVSGDKNEDSKGLYDYWVLELDENFQILEQNTIGGSGSDSPGTLIEDSNSGVILVGTSMSDISGDKTENSFGSQDAWIVKLNEFELGINDLPVAEIAVYPVPARDLIYFSTKANVIEHLEIFDILGRSIVKKEPGSDFFTMDISNFSNGLYYCKLLVKGEKTLKKFLKE